MKPKIFFLGSIDILRGNREKMDDPSEADILVLGARQVDIRNFPKVKIIYRFGTGTDNIPYGYKFMLPNPRAIDILCQSVSDFAVYLILRSLFNRWDSNWIREPIPLLQDKNVLIVGMGKIGSEVFRKIGGFVNLSSYDIRFNPGNELEGLIRNADIITLHIPLNSENYDFIDKEKLGWMKENVRLINTARAHLVSENDLFERMKSTKMVCCFDVLWKEPYFGRLKVFNPDRFFTTPHMAGYTQEFIDECSKDLDKLERELCESE